VDGVVIKGRGQAVADYQNSGAYRASIHLERNTLLVRSIVDDQRQDPGWLDRFPVV
jgi:hypothetical protein